MKAISARNSAGSLVAGCLLLALVSAGCSCGPEASVSLPTDTPLATSIASPTPNSPTVVPKEVAGLEVDTSLLTDNPCRVPCWHNIIPGESDVDHVRAQLEDDPTVWQSTLTYELTEEGGVPIGLFYWRRAKGELWNRIVLHNETVVRMEIYVDHDWTLGDVVDKFGSPEYVASYPYGEEGTGYFVVFYYPAQGLQFHSNTFPFTREFGITRDLKVTEGVYFAPTTLEGMIREAYLCPPEKMEACRLDDVREWEGFED